MARPVGVSASAVTCMHRAQYAACTNASAAAGAGANRRGSKARAPLPHALLSTTRPKFAASGTFNRSQGLQQQGTGGRGAGRSAGWGGGLRVGRLEAAGSDSHPENADEDDSEDDNEDSAGEEEAMSASSSGSSPAADGAGEGMGPVGDNNDADSTAASFAEAEWSLLQKRMARQQETETELPLILLDAMLPRQRLLLSIPPHDTMNQAMLNAALNGSRTFAMLGMDRRTQTPLRHGTEVEITSSTVEEDGNMEIEIVGRRRLALIGEPLLLEAGYTVGRVEFNVSEPPLDFEEQSKLLDLSNQLDLLVEEWRRLVVEGDHERHQDQLSNLFRDLGPIPPPEDCDDRAMWVAALINPLPALGVALEIRPAVLSAQSTTTRLQVALAGIQSSINHLNGTKPLF
eukprot:CAMPEP_0114258912 /NCGR_PEP_ID=MMETSP0058-20121206/19599_1 /TAXON_ID=36894 /ORGANISM="Pyramimonas parkeae, CCMP726" /LENGTH=401 /DNA_ID=CAMNT_0001373897 /DNA_START=6 /DNA_END=1210 /DNA_ORIENTATION=-